MNTSRSSTRATKNSSVVMAPPLDVESNVKDHIRRKRKSDLNMEFMFEALDSWAFEPELEAISSYWLRAAACFSSVPGFLTTQSPLPLK